MTQDQIAGAFNQIVERCKETMLQNQSLRTELHHLHSEVAALKRFLQACPAGTPQPPPAAPPVQAAAPAAWSAWGGGIPSASESVGGAAPPSLSTLVGGGFSVFELQPLNQTCTGPAPFCFLTGKFQRWHHRHQNHCSRGNRSGRGGKCRTLFLASF